MAHDELKRVQRIRDSDDRPDWSQVRGSLLQQVFGGVETKKQCTELCLVGGVHLVLQLDTIRSGSHIWSNDVYTDVSSL